MLTDAGRAAAVGALSGECVLLDPDGATIDTDRVPVLLGEPVTVTFGPAPTDWRVAGAAIVRDGRRIALSRFVRTAVVRAGQSFELMLDVGVG